MSPRPSVKEIITTKIARGEFSPGERLPAERSIAAELGVSRLTVQNAVKELELEGLLLRQPNCRPVVRRLRNEIGHDQVAVWLPPDVQDLGGMLMLQGIRSVLGSANLSILMGCPPPGQSEDQAEQEFLQAALVNPQVAGVIVWEMYSNECRRLYSELVDKGVAVVFIDRAPAFPVAADFVGTDNVGAAKEAVNHLIRLGHKRISIVLRDHVASSVQDRLQGYRLALSDANIPFDQGLVVDYPCDPAIPVQVRMESLLKDLLAQRDPATAIFAINDSIALHLLEAARSLGVKAPDRLSILGFDWLLRNLPMGGELTTVAQPFEEIGQTAAQRLIERIREAELSLGTSSTPRKILFQAPLVIRNSTGRAHLPG